MLNIFTPSRILNKEPLNVRDRDKERGLTKSGVRSQWFVVGSSLPNTLHSFHFLLPFFFSFHNPTALWQVYKDEIFRTLDVFQIWLFLLHRVINQPIQRERERVRETSSRIKRCMEENTQRQTNITQWSHNIWKEKVKAFPSFFTYLSFGLLKAFFFSWRWLPQNFLKEKLSFPCLINMTSSHISSMGFSCFCYCSV